MSRPVPAAIDDPAAAVARLLERTPAIERLGALFAEAGHSLHLVGGPVRDALLGRPGCCDLDFTTSARPDDIERLLHAVSPAVWSIGKEFGTIGCKLGEWVVEVTTYRSDVYRSESRKPEVAFGDTLDGDLGRRDFTVNAMAVSLPDGAFVDPFGGLADLVEGVLRTPGTPEQSFSDDPLRMMRAARFASQLSFAPAPDVVRAMRAMAERIEIVSAERVRDEIVKLMLTERPRPGLVLLVATGLAERVLPELAALVTTVDEHGRHKDVFEHSLTVMEQAIELEARRGHDPDVITRLAALLHDVGKPPTRRFVEGGRVTFHHHDVVGAKMLTKRLRALKFSGDEVKAVARLTELHLRFHGYGEGEWTDSAVRRYVRDAGEQLERLHILTRADCTTRNRRKAARLRAAYDDLEERINRLAEAEELDAIRPDLDGEQIMAVLGLSPGREVGEAYRFLLEHRMEHGPLDEEAATAVLKEWWASR